MNYTADDIISRFDLKPLPNEGGWYNEIFRSPEMIDRAALASRYPGPRAYSTAIYYMITPQNSSKMHKVASDEIFCFHLGGAAKMLLLCPGGRVETPVLGTDLDAGEMPQVIVPAGTWMGIMMKNENEPFSLMSCIVAPGFEFEDYTHADKQNILKTYPAVAEMIEKLT
jgi:uncharacterized protein